MYFKIPIINNIPDIDFDFVENIFYTQAGECYVKLRPGYNQQPSWQSLTETQWQAIQPPSPEPGPTSEPPETTEQKLARLEEQNIILMDALATTFEEVLALRAIVEGGTAV